MSIPITLNYNDSADYDFPDTIDITGGKAQLKLLEDNVDFTEDFADDTGFIYDSNKSEFIGGLNRQKDQTDDATSGARFSDDIDLEDWSDGIVTGTAYGGASISNGKLDLAHSDIRYTIHDATNNVMIGNTGAFRCWVTPNYNGSPSTSQVFSLTRKSDISNANLLLLRHDTGGEILLFMYDKNQSIIMSGDSFGVWSPTSGTEYKIELNIDIITGATRLFIDGTQFGSTNIKTGDRTTEIGELVIGTNVARTDASNFYIRNVMFFNTVQHTSNYTPSSDNVSEYKYAETSVVLPEMEHTGDGSILAFNLLSLTYSGSPRILLEIGRSGDDLYWDGSSLAVSDGSYDQAVDLATFNLHIDAFEVESEKYGQFTIVYPGSNSISAVSELTANMLVNIGYSTVNPLIKPKLATKVDGLEDWDEVVEKTGSDDVKAIVELNGANYYHNGVVWAVSSGYSQSNSVAEILANKSSLLIEGYGKNFRIGRYLHSADGSTTPKLDTDTLSVNFSGISPTIKEIFIYGNLRDIIEGLESTTIYYRWPWSVGGKVVLTDDYQEYETFPEGYFEISIKHEDGHPPAYFEFKIKTKLFRFEYPSDELLAEGDYIEIGDLILLFTKRIVSF